MCNFDVVYIILFKLKLYAIVDGGSNLKVLQLLSQSNTLPTPQKMEHLHVMLKFHLQYALPFFFNIA